MGEVRTLPKTKKAEEDPLAMGIRQVDKEHTWRIWRRTGPVSVSFCSVWPQSQAVPTSP